MVADGTSCQAVILVIFTLDDDSPAPRHAAYALTLASLRAPSFAPPMSNWKRREGMVVFAKRADGQVVQKADRSREHARGAREGPPDPTRLPHHRPTDLRPPASPPPPPDSIATSPYDHVRPAARIRHPARRPTGNDTRHAHVPAWHRARVHCPQVRAPTCPARPPVAALRSERTGTNVKALAGARRALRGRCMRSWWPRTAGA
ncbi:hypothetical protein B0H10DRAFT_2202435 [Mycena sp. CBHHK59/15]|nr:hypothetical protein B0H10DRAFT_2202435 [Mycena sp. CBHHK59/15]